MKPFRRVAIIGTGLIGGSIGLALRRRNVVRIGFDRPTVLSKASKMGAIDRGAKSLKEAMDGSDLVILAMPVGIILDLLPKLAQMVQPATLITDVGSTKAEICKSAQKNLKNFIGGHPLAGKEKSGVENADSKLFVGKNWFLCPNGNLLGLARMKAFIQMLGAKPVVTEPEKHDRILAATSHLPQLVSTLLAATVAELLGKETKRMQVFAGPGLRDSIRLGHSPFSVWGGIFASNQREVGRALETFCQKAAGISDNFQDLETVKPQFKKANIFVRKLG